MTIARYSILAALVTMSLPLTARAQSITADEVTAVVESTAVKGAFNNCASSWPHPDQLEFVFVVGTDGHASLQATNPPVTPELFQCFQTASGAIVFPPSKAAFEVTYTMELVPFSGTVPVGQTVLVVAAGCTKDIDCKGARVCQNGQCYDKFSTSAPQKLRYSNGTSLLVGGAIVSSFGVLMFVGTIANGVAAKDSDHISGVGLSAAGTALGVVGGALVMGGATRAYRWCQALGGVGSRAWLSAGWALFGVSVATEAVLTAVGGALGLNPIVFGAPALAVSLVTFVVNSVGWSVQKRLVTDAARNAQEGPAALFVPYVSPLPGGASAGIVAVY